MKSRKFLYTAVVLLVAAIGWYVISHPDSPAVSRLLHGAVESEHTTGGATPNTIPPSAAASVAAGNTKPRLVKPSAPVLPLTPQQQQVEANKAIDREHLKKLHAGVLGYKTKYGHYPEYLSQLVPEFVSADTLVSPNGTSMTAKQDHPDPGLTAPNYGYEFSNLEFRDGRTFAEIKEIQRSEWGDVVPMLRYFGYDKVLNCSCRGDIYETALNWEWDPATLNMVDKYGWGDGLKVGQMVDVKVLDPNGQPVPGAKVYADGRNYSFDLPDRPYTADAAGNVKIPIGADVDRTALQLRMSAPGLSSQTMSFERGDVPTNQTLTASAAQAVGGQILDADGYPAANLRVALRTPIGEAPAGEAPNRFTTVAQVTTDADGNWSTSVHPADASRFIISTTVAGPHSGGFSAEGNLPVDHATAVQGRAVINLK